MLGAFVYLAVCGVRNRIRLRLRRLREPRYLIGSIVGAVYLYTMVFQRVIHQTGRTLPRGMVSMLDRLGGPLEFVGSLLLFVMAAGTWVTPGAGASIEFTRAEIQMLFPAPLTRRQLLHYKLLRGQIAALFGSLVATVFLRPGSMGEAWTVLVGILLLFTVLRLHLMGVALRRMSLAQHGRSGLARQWLPVAIVGGAVLILLAQVAADWTSISGMTTGFEVFEELQRLAGAGAARWILWPFRAVVELPLSGSPQKFLAALPPVLVLLVLNYLWVLRGDARFEEAAAADAERRAAVRKAPAAARREGKPLASPFTLRLSGRPETVILWKNLILLGRYASMRTLARFIPVVVVLLIVFSRTRDTEGLASLASGLSLMLAGMTVVIGPQIMRNDLRQDLASLAVLKSWPIRGAALVRGELLAPALVLTVVTWLLLFAGAALTRPSIAEAAGAPFGLNAPLTLAVAGAVVAPAVILAQLVLHNGMAILFPAWVTVGQSRARGIDAMGQRLLTMAGVILALGTALVPAGLVAGLVGFIIYTITRTVPILAPAATLAVLMVGECWIAAGMLGRVLDRTDVGALEPVD